MDIDKNKAVINSTKIIKPKIVYKTPLWIYVSIAMFALVVGVVVLLQIVKSNSVFNLVEDNSGRISDIKPTIPSQYETFIYFKNNHSEFNLSLTNKSKLTEFIQNKWGTKPKISIFTRGWDIARPSILNIVISDKPQTHEQFVYTHEDSPTLLASLADEYNAITNELTVTIGITDAYKSLDLIETKDIILTKLLQYITKASQNRKLENIDYVMINNFIKSEGINIFTIYHDK